MINNIREQYEERYNKYLVKMAEDVEALLKDLFGDTPRIDRIVARAKSIDRFVEKANINDNNGIRYSDPLNQIQDQVGARIVTFYKDDVVAIREGILDYFRNIEDKMIVPDKDSDFGYFGQHFILLYPEDIVQKYTEKVIPFFELQIKTLFQHAWSEANHDLGYKPDGEISSELRRNIAFCSAQAWGADKMFSEVFKELNQQRTETEQIERTIN